ncbi:MAG: hypothetical protein GEU91_23550 [Rhizobiales bacterium]|nr:hypothetical protein [Hyphomicrobiales bacterium]
MRRRQFIASLLVAVLTGRNDSAARSEGFEVSNGVPEKIRLIPDKWHIHNVGRLADGSSFLVDSQLDPAGGTPRDFVCTFIFDHDGRLVEHSIELIGVRDAYPRGSVGSAKDRHLATLGKRAIAGIWVRPFEVESNGTVFGLIPRQTEDGAWRVEFMPGNTLSFYPPWEAGGYDT